VSTWGDGAGTEKVFNRAECWALRQGRAHFVSRPADGAVCSHLTCVPTGGYVCIPITSLGETLGLLTICWRSDGAETGPPRMEGTFSAELAAALGEHAALALAKIRLTRRWRAQAVTDQLTGLYNRRFLVETLDGNCSRRSRSSAGGRADARFGQLQAINDATARGWRRALRAFALQLKASVRTEDVACRYGGDEFAVVLPDSSLEQASRRADQIARRRRPQSSSTQGNRSRSRFRSASRSPQPPARRQTPCCARRMTPSMWPRTESRSHAGAAIVDTPVARRPRIDDVAPTTSSARRHF